MQTRTMGTASVLLGLLFLAAWLVLPGLAPLMTPDEGRYAEIAREMVAGGDWITPHLNGYLYFEKPPLQYWMTALAFEVFGIGEWSARLWSALSFLVSGAAIVSTASRLFGAGAARATALVYAGTLYPCIFGQVNTLDSGLAACLTVALCSFLLAFGPDTPERARGRFMLACWAAIALGVLSKGLVALVIPGASLALYMAVTRQWTLALCLNWAAGPALFALIAVPWFALVWMRNPDFGQFFFIHEHFARYLTDVHRREEPWWYFLALLALGALPWTPLLPASLRESLAEGGAGFRPRLLLAIWVLFVLVFFSLSHSKLSGYLTPLFPALALLLGERISRAPAVLLRPAIATAFVVWLGVLVATFLAERIPGGRLGPAEVAALAAGARWAALAGVLGAALAWRRQALAPLALGSCAATLLLVASIGPYARSRSAIGEVAAAANEFASASQVYSVDGYDQTLPFYLGREVRLVEFTGEFEFGMARAPGMFPQSHAAFLEEWRNEPRPVALVWTAAYERLRDEGLPMQVVYRGRGRVVVTRPPG